MTDDNLRGLDPSEDDPFGDVGLPDDLGDADALSGFPGVQLI
jgi:hypothetical protein